MVSFTEYEVLPSLALVLAAYSVDEPVWMPASPEANHATLSEIFLSYAQGWGNRTHTGRIIITGVNILNYEGQAQFDVSYDRCYRCTRNSPARVYFMLPLSKMNEIKALIDVQEIKAALDKPCTLPQASNWYETADVRVLYKGNVVGSTPILLSCRSPELDKVRGKLDKAMSLVNGWLLNHLAEQKPSSK